MGNRGRDEAERRAFIDLVLEWHRRHGESVVEWRCAGCGEEIGDKKALLVGDHSRVHLDGDYGLDCLIIYGQRWRDAATDGHVAMGLPSPSLDAS